jgi:hypothetical protein
MLIYEGAIVDCCWDLTEINSVQYLFLNGLIIENNCLLHYFSYGAGTKRLLDVDFLSHREKAKRNRLLRNLPVLPQHTEEKYEETESYVENGLRSADALQGFRIVQN